MMNPIRTPLSAQKPETHHKTPKKSAIPGTLLTLSLTAVLMLFMGIGEVKGQFILAEDEADNYSSWTAGSNEGFGFLPWVFNSGGNAGRFRGNPTEGGISGMSDPVFVLFANGADTFSDTDRAFRQPLPVGATFSFQWGVNFDSDRSDGNKGFNLYTGGTGGTQVINVNQGNSATITINGSTMFSVYGTQAITFNFERVSSNELRVFATGRDGVESYDQTFDIGSSAIDAIRFYAANLNNDSGNTNQRRPYFDNFAIETDDFANVPDDAQVRFTENFTLSEDKTLNRVIIDAGTTFTASDATPRTLTITGGGSLTNNGTFIANDGKVVFAGSGSLIGSLDLNNADLSGSVTIINPITVNGDFRILPNGFANTTHVTFGNESTLVFETGGGYEAGEVWPGGENNAPNNIRIVNTSLSFVGDNFVRYLNGDLTIETEGSLALSTNIGGDLRIRGNWTNAGTFNANNRAVYFDGTEPQTILNEQEAGIAIPFLFIENDVRALSNLTVTETLNLVDNTLTIG